MSSTPQPTGATPPPQQQPESSQQQPQPQPTPEPQSDADADPDSPPLPPAPVPAVVIPGPRAARLQQLFASTLHHTLDKVVRGGNFGACFPTVAARAPGTLEFVQRQMVDRLRGLCEVCFFLIPFFFEVLFCGDWESTGGGRGVMMRGDGSVGGLMGHVMFTVTCLKDSRETTCPPISPLPVPPSPLPQTTL